MKNGRALGASARFLPSLDFLETISRQATLGERLRELRWKNNA